MLTERLPTFIGRMRMVDLTMICGWIVKVWEEIPSDIIKREFLKCCISNNVDGTEDDIIWEEEAANDGDSNVDLLYPDSGTATLKLEFLLPLHVMDGRTCLLLEAEPLRCLAFHPSGDFLLVGTAHPTLRLYDTITLACFVSPQPRDQHTDALTAVAFAPSATTYVSASRDGAIKLWDGVSGRCISTFTRAHAGAPVSSVAFTRNGKYVLSSGKDSIVRLWEISTGRALLTYTGAGLSGKPTHRVQAVFNHTEDFVLLPDEWAVSLCAWEARTAQRRGLLALGHNNTVRAVAHSPTAPGLMTCSDDFRARFWYRRTGAD